MQLMNMPGMKAFYDSALTNYASFTKLTRHWPKNNSNASALFFPPASRGSLGDEAMLVGGIHYLRNQGFKKVGIVSRGEHDTWNFLAEADEVLKLEGWSRSLNFINAINHYSHFYCLGADIMDGYYSSQGTLIRLAELASKAGSNVTITGFSFNSNPTLDAIRAITSLPANIRFCTRDPISYERFLKHTHRAVSLVADLAFLLQPNRESTTVREVSAWIDSQKSKKHVVVGINISSTLVKNGDKINADKLLNTYKNALTELFEKYPNLSILMIPHDDRDKVSDVSLSEILLKALPEELRQFCGQVPFPCSASEIKAICGELDIVLSGRMHLAIACLGQATPVACITYQGKFEGLCKHFNIDGITITPQQAFQPGELAQFIFENLERRHQLRAQIQKMLPTVKTLAAANFDGLTIQAEKTLVSK